MNIALLYLFIGLISYPAAMDMSYRIDFKRQKFYAPSQLHWYGGFLLFVISWPISVPFLSYQYLKEMSK